METKVDLAAELDANPYMATAMWDENGYTIKDYACKNLDEYCKEYPHDKVMADFYARMKDGDEYDKTNNERVDVVTYGDLVRYIKHLIEADITQEHRDAAIAYVINRHYWCHVGNNTTGEPAENAYIVECSYVLLRQLFGYPKKN